MKIKSLLTAFLLLALSTSGFAQTWDKEKLNQFLEQLSKNNKAMGSLVIDKDGQEVYSRSIGFSQISDTQKKPLTADTRYRIGSITKMFTAALIFQLIEEGKLTLNDPLGEFFPQIPNANNITIAQMLAHRSGIQDVMEIQEFRAHRLKPITKEELLAIVAKGIPDFAPDTKYAYSNSGYILLAMLLEKVTGKPYQEVLQKRILSKAGMQNTYVGTGTIDANKNESFSYRFVSDWELQPETHISLLYGSGFLISTPSDMVKFAQALFNLKLVSQESLNQMTQQKLGMDTFTYNGKTFYGHTGGIDGFGAWLAYLPEEKLTVSYAANGKVYPVAKMMDGITDIYFNQPFTIPSFETIAISPEVLDQYTGVYATTEAPVKFTITRDNTTLLMRMNEQSAVPLEPIAQNKFKLERAGMLVEFDAAKNQMTIKRGERDRLFTKEK